MTTENLVLSQDNTKTQPLTRGERSHIQTLERRYRHIERQISTADNPHHPRMSFMLAEESALRWALERLTGVRPERIK